MCDKECPKDKRIRELEAALKPLELKPCPFCGSGDIQTYRGSASQAIVCLDCNASVEIQKPAHYFEVAIAAWNRRTPSPVEAAKAQDAKPGEGGRGV